MLQHRLMITEWARALRETGYRGLVVLHTLDTTRGVSALVSAAEEAGHKNILCVFAGAKPEDKSLDCYTASASSIERILGREFDSTIIAAPGFLAPNTVAAAAETVRGGGFLALVVPPIRYWRPGGTASTSTYRKYLLERIKDAKSLLWLDLEESRVLAYRLPGKAPERRKSYVKSRSGVPRKLLEKAVSDEQAMLLDEAVDALRKRARSIVIIGDRGRGKSGLLALITAYLIARHEVGFVAVTAPTVWNVQSYFSVLAEALKALTDRWWLIRRGEAVIGVAGPWFHVRYHTPEAVEPGPYTVIDEAAAIGPLRLRRIVRRATRVLAATTIHGYEGSGKTFTKMILDWMPKPQRVLEVKEPVRYPPGDPLEQWLFETFLLDAEPEKPPQEVNAKKLRYYRVERETLTINHALLKAVYGVLVEAHYRNEPNDLVLMIDAPHHRVRAAIHDGYVVAALQSAIEDCRLPYEWRRLIDLIGFHEANACGTRGLRVVRIAVVPDLQGRGVGSWLLRRFEEEALSEGFDWVGAVYGRVEVTGFWLRNGYYVVYVSPLPSKMTGEKNVAVAKPLTSRGRDVVENAARAFRYRLLLTLSTTYRDLPAEIATLMLSTHLPLPKPPLQLTKEQLRRLEKLAEGSLDVEAVSDAAYVLTVDYIAVKGSLDLEKRMAIAVVARILQGKSLDDVAAMLSTSRDEVREIVRRGIVELYRRLGGSVIEGSLTI